MDSYSENSCANLYEPNVFRYIHKALNIRVTLHVCDTKMPFVTPAAVFKRPDMSQFDFAEVSCTVCTFFHQKSICIGFMLLPSAHSKQGLLLHDPTLSSHIYIVSYISLHPIRCSTPFAHSFLLPAFLSFFVPQPKPTPICLL